MNRIGFWGFLLALALPVVAPSGGHRLLAVDSAVVRGWSGNGRLRVFVSSSGSAGSPDVPVGQGVAQRFRLTVGGAAPALIYTASAAPTPTQTPVPTTAATPSATSTPTPTPTGPARPAMWMAY